MNEHEIECPGSFLLRISVQWHLLLCFPMSYVAMDYQKASSRYVCSFLQMVAIHEVVGV